MLLKHIFCKFMNLNKEVSQTYPKSYHTKIGEPDDSPQRLKPSG
jgi:hypothetical protein